MANKHGLTVEHRQLLNIFQEMELAMLRTRDDAERGAKLMYLIEQARNLVDTDIKEPRIETDRQDRMNCNIRISYPDCPQYEPPVTYLGNLDEIPESMEWIKMVLEGARSSIEKQVGVRGG